MTINKHIAKRIILTGGGTAGHVIPNLSLLPALKQAGWDIQYIGSKGGLEKGLVKDLVPFHHIASGKLRRYFSIQNFFDIFNILLGIFQAIFLLIRLKPNIIFSKGGFVTVPVCLAGKILNIPVLIHESDLSPGLANKIAGRFAKQILVSFEDTLKFLGPKKSSGTFTGPPLRPDIHKGDIQSAKKLFASSNNKPYLLATGGSLGSQILNNGIQSCLPELLDKFNVIHICGKGHLPASIHSAVLPSNSNVGHYFPVEFLGEEMIHVLTLADVIVSRAGSNAIFEFLALKKPHLLIPLSKKASRGDQIENAESFEKKGYSKVLLEEDLTGASLIHSLNELWNNRDSYILAMTNSKAQNSNEKIVGLINQFAK